MVREVPKQQRVMFATGKANININTHGNNFRFPGQYFDDTTSLHYNYHRYYDPAIGRYLRADPIGVKGGTNFYVYANQNPINFLDLFGLYESPWYLKQKKVTGTLSDM